MLWERPKGAKQRNYFIAVQEMCGMSKCSSRRKALKPLMDDVIWSSSVHIMWQSLRYTAILSSFQISSACCIYLDLHWVLFTLEKQMLSIIELVIGGTDRIKKKNRTFNG